jgi:hypothetical protein
MGQGIYSELRPRPFGKVAKQESSMNTTTDRLRQLERIAGPDDPIYQSSISFHCLRGISKHRKYDFAAAVAQGLREIGAREAGPYGWQLDTIGGLLDITPYEDWVACRFDDVARANETIQFGSLNHHSGKWNWLYCKPDAADVNFFLQHLKLIRLIYPATSSTDE